MALYDAFISYSHAKDKPIASALQSVVQKLGKPWYRRRAVRLFRDDTSLSATPGLWPTIESALNESRYFILLASRDAASSKWVNKEGSHWLAHKSADTLLIGLTEGELIWDDGLCDFARNEVLPPALVQKFPAEPKWVDLRAYRDGAGTGNAKFTELAADFAAAIRGMPKEDLLSEEVRQQRRALTLAWSSAASLLILAALAFFFYGRAQQSERETRQQAAGSTYRTALQEQQQGFDEAALAYLAKAGRLDPENRSVTTAMLMLLGNQYWPSLAIPDLRHKDIVNSARFSADDGRVVTASADRTAMIWDARTATPLIGPLQHNDVVFGARFSPDGGRVLTWSNDNTAQVWDARTGKRIGKALQHRGWVTNARFDATGQLVVTGSFDCTARVWDAATGEPIGPALQHRGWVDSVEFSPDGNQILTAADSQDRANPEICLLYTSPSPRD